MTLFEGLKSRYRNVLHTHSHDEAAAVLSNTCSDNLVLFCGVREPISREISAFFENIDNDRVESNLDARSNNCHLHEYYFGGRCAIENSDIDDLIGFFNLAMRAHISKLVGSWFDRFQGVTGLDFRRVDFDKMRGFSRFEVDGLVIYIYRQENLACFITHLQSQKMFKGINYNSKNVSKNKWHVDVQNRFKSHYHITERTYKEVLRETNWIYTFYTYEELRSFAAAYIESE